MAEYVAQQARRSVSSTTGTAGRARRFFLRGDYGSKLMRAELVGHRPELLRDDTFVLKEPGHAIASRD